jgi:hypothetical protein
MQNISVLAGSTGVSVVLRIVDSTDGTPETGVVFNTAGIDLQYRREGAASTAITEVTQTVSGAHTSGGFVHIGNGYYRLDLPDAAVAAGASGVLVHGTVTDMIVIGAYINLRNVPADVRAYGGTAGTFASGRPEVNASHIAGNAVNTSSAQIGVNVVNAAGTAWGSGAITAGSISDNAITANKLATAAITAGKFAAGAIDAAALANNAITADKIAADAIGESELAASAVNEIRDAILAATVETRANSTINLAAALRILVAVAAGQRSGNTYLSPDGTANRVAGTVTGGDRTAITVTTTT